MRLKTRNTPSSLAIAIAFAGTLTAHGYYLDTQGGSLHHAMISGNWVAWGEINQGAISSIYARNLVSGELKAIVADDPATPDVLEATANIWNWAWWHPQIGISGSTVVFSDRRSGVISIRTYNLETGAEAVVSPTSWTDNLFPAIDGNRVVWQYGSSRAYAATTTGASRVSLAVGDYPLPDVDADIAVWKVGNSVESTIKYRNLATGANGTLFHANSSQDLRSVVIDGNVVAWTMRDQDPLLGTVVRIMAYDMSTGTLTTVKDHTGTLEHRSMVSVSNGIVVWEDWRNSQLQRDIYGYNLATGEEFAVDTSPADQRGPCIDGDIVTWSEGEVGGRIGWVRLSELLKPLLLGDVNLDGLVNALDIAPFVERLTARQFQAEADINRDGVLNALDIEDFVTLITGEAASGATVPEPAAGLALLAGIGALLLPGSRRK